MDTTGDYWSCYWNDIGCGALGKPDGWYDCYWYDLCDGLIDPIDPVGFDTFEEWLECYEVSWDCEDVGGVYYDCYAYDIGCTDPDWHDCYWYSDCGEDEEDEKTSFYEWLACYTETYEDCGDEEGLFYDCYMYEECAGVVNEYWHDCYWYDIDCALWENPWGGPYQEFNAWLRCYEIEGGGDECSDPQGTFWDCYMDDVCNDVTHPDWHSCYWYNINCKEDTDTGEPDEGDDPAHDGTPGERFQEWLDCYEATYDVCDEDWYQHSEYYDCYWENIGCEDAYWHDCYWYYEDCEWMEGLNEDYIGGYMDGYDDGYWDGVIDTMPALPRDDDMSDFQLQMIITSFESWT